MIDTLAAPDSVEELSASELLRAAGGHQSAVWAGEVELLRCAAQWAVLHPAESIADVAATWLTGMFSEEAVAISGPGCPLIAEFAVAELGAVLHLSSTAAKKLIGDALELQHRLPKTWQRVTAGDCAPWRARLAAQATIHACPELSAEAAAWIDHQIAAQIGRISTARMERLIREAIERFRTVDADEDEIPDPHHATLETRTTAGKGTLVFHAAIEPADALDLDHALAHAAAALKAAGCEKPLKWRRAKALGDIARTYTSERLAEIQSGTVQEGAQRPAGPSARRLDLSLHLRPVVGPDGIGLDVISTLNSKHLIVLTEQIKDWCTDSLTEVRIRPVLDLNDEITSKSYTPSPRLRRQVLVRDKDCMFPWCTRNSLCCDLDHIHPFSACAPADSQTVSSNLVPLCRSHHRLKTHGRWKEVVLSPGTVLWTDPHGSQYRCDSAGTTAL